jgi:hypothetical protein
MREFPSGKSYHIDIYGRLWLMRSPELFINVISGPEEELPCLNKHDDAYAFLIGGSNIWLALESPNAPGISMHYWLLIYDDDDGLKDILYAAPGDKEARQKLYKRRIMLAADHMLASYYSGAHDASVQLYGQREHAIYTALSALSTILPAVAALCAGDTTDYPRDKLFAAQRNLGHAIETLTRHKE